MTTQKQLDSGVVATWREVVRTEMDYNAKVARAEISKVVKEELTI